MTPNEAYEECQQEVIRAGALEPQGWKERMAAGVIVSNGGRWADTEVAQSRLRQWTADCLRRKGFVT